MSLISLFTLRSPSIGALEFDAVFEDVYEAEVELATYELESGVSAADHGIVMPRKWSMVGGISNTPLLSQAAADVFSSGFSAESVTGFLSGVADSVGLGGPYVGAAGGINAAVLAGSGSSRASSALQTVMEMLTGRQTFTVSAGDITLNNMKITKVRRAKTPENENGIIFEIDMIEQPTLSVLRGTGLEPSQDMLRDGDQAKSQAAATVDKGQRVGGALDSTQQSQLGEYAA